MYTVVLPITLLLIFITYKIKSRTFINCTLTYLSSISYHYSSLNISPSYREYSQFSLIISLDNLIFLSMLIGLPTMHISVTGFIATANLYIQFSIYILTYLRKNTYQKD